jgi:hypothetical protein
MRMPCSAMESVYGRSESKCGCRPPSLPLQVPCLEIEVHVWMLGKHMCMLIDRGGCGAQEGEREREIVMQNACRVARAPSN